MKGQTIISIVFASLLTAYVLFAFVFYPSRSETTVCKELSIKVEDENKRAYVTPAELKRFVTAECGPIVGDTIDNVRLSAIEKSLLNHPMLRTAEAWCSPEGVLHLSVTQRQPVLRVMGDENYYVDADRKRMPVRTTTAAYVPVITGRVSQRFATGELYDFVLWLEDDDYWRAQIEQINVVTPKRIELIPRVGSGTVVLGSLEDYPAKLRKLKKLYLNGFSNFGWNDYAEVDLRFRGQVVCRR